MNIYRKCDLISKYLENRDLINQYTHFIKGVYIVQPKAGIRFSPNFLKWLDENEIEAVYLASVLEDKVYSIVVKED